MVPHLLSGGSLVALWWLLQTAGPVQRLPVHIPLCLQVTGWLWHYKVSLGPQMSPGHPRLLITMEDYGDSAWLCCFALAQHRMSSPHL